MRNTLAPSLQIELFREGSNTPDVLGTDCVLFIDGRWNQDRANDYVTERAEQESKRRKLEWRGTVYLLGSRYRSETILRGV